MVVACEIELYECMVYALAKRDSDTDIVRLPLLPTVPSLDNKRWIWMDSDYDIQLTALSLEERYFNMP